MNDSPTRKASQITKTESDIRIMFAENRNLCRVQHSRFLKSFKYNGSAFDKHSAITNNSSGKN
jgi:hypothetical protein